MNGTTVELSKITNLVRENIIFTIIIVCIVLYVYIIFICRTTENNLLHGVWKIDQEFSELTDLNTGVLYIGESSNGYNAGVLSKCFAYCILSNDNGLIINSSAMLEFNNICLRPYVKRKIETQVKFSWLDNEKYDFFPEIQRLTVEPYIGKLTFSTLEGEITAIFYKDSDASDLNKV